MKKHLFPTLLGLFLMLCGCNEPSPGEKLSALNVDVLHKASAEEIEKLVAQFIEAKAGTTIKIPEGYYEMPTQLILDKVDNISIKGQDKYRTVFSFKTISTGGEGMKISGNGVTLEGFTVMDAPGDCIKTQHCDGVTFRDINATWTNQDLTKNGTYGIYPVQCKNVLVENCEVSHSRDAGIYVGQSENIVVRNCFSHENVAGIEIENCDNAEVFDNVAENNTAGILVFNLPLLQKAMGSRTRVYNNTLKANNHYNFAVSSNGNAITMVPPGTGVLVLAGNEVEVANNTFIENRTSAVMIASYQFTQLPVPEHPGWTPFTTNIHVHDNSYQKNAEMVPDTTKPFSRLIAMTCKTTQDVVYDGVFDVSRMQGNAQNPMNVAIRENAQGFKFTRFVLPADGNMANISVSNDLESFGTFTGAIKTDVQNLKQPGK